MQIHLFPASTTSRPILLLCAQHSIPVEFVVVDITTGAHYREPFVSLNPNKKIPVLTDESFVLTEGSAILKYLASQFAPEVYPDALRPRALVDSRMDWFNTLFYMDYGFHLVYPQVVPQQDPPAPVVQEAVLREGQRKSREWFTVLDQHILGGAARYVCGEKVTIADYLGAAYVSLGDLIGVSLEAYPNAARWMATMKSLGSWSEVNQAFNQWVAACRDRSFVTI